MITCFFLTTRVVVSTKLNSHVRREKTELIVVFYVLNASVPLLIDDPLPY